LKTTLTVEHVLAARAEYDHELSIRAIGPAIAIVLEREGPLRMETLSSTEAEFDALKEECRSNPRWQELLDVYFGLKADEEGIADSALWQREGDHVRRLNSGSEVNTPRIAERVHREQP
jgi:hypothetical protein